MNIKQVIVMRHDLKMRRGKQIAQGAHASMAFLQAALQGGFTVGTSSLTPAEVHWLDGDHKKICCRVDSEFELQELYDQADQAGLTVHMVVDSGLTEFNNVPTKTCIAIGPDDADEIDEVTGCLELL